jgi:hypothetical protein
MSVRRLAPVEQQPASFAFTAENLAWAKRQIAKYPEGRQASAVIPILWRAQEQSGGWLPQKAIEHVAGLLDMAQIRVLEVATFYAMFQLALVGRKAHVQLCGTTPCMLRGADLRRLAANVFTPAPPPPRMGALCDATIKGALRSLAQCAAIKLGQRKNFTPRRPQQQPARFFL